MRNSCTILITGASSGIGQACATYLHQQGHRVYGTSRRPVDTFDTPFEMLQMNVNDEQSIQQGIELILQKEGRLDVVVNNAGFGIAGAIEDTNIDEAKAQFETNFYGTLRVCRAVLPVMRAQHFGYVINISSIAGLIGVAFQGMYSASKFAIEGMSEALSAEVKPFGIRVVLVEPGDVCTQFTAARIRTVGSQENPIHAERMNNALQVMERDEQQGESPIEIAHLISRVIRTPSPRLRYQVGPLYEKLAIGLKKILPARFFEWAIMKYYCIG